MKKHALMLSLFLLSGSLAVPSSGKEEQQGENLPPQGITISKETLKDKIKGGWAGQTIGVTFGGPTEFRFNGTFIQDYQSIPWYNGYIRETMEKNPGLYDDIYMDLTFVDIFEKKGLDAPVEDFAQAYAHAEYKLWHANQAGRYNILQGMEAPESGHWLNNPHADCIDYQIESDFAGLMSPGMPNTASEISDKIGHIMNYGDGWYGGVYMGAMYSLAFVSNDIPYIVSEGLKAIPSQSRFYQCIRDVVQWHQQYPDDWKQTWFEIQKKWSEDIGCPDGVFVPLNIDAKTNAAYVVLGLLYGKGDFGKTMEISTRAGQDSDCNPSSAGGILGTVMGYENIPAYWKMGLKEAEAIRFKYTTISLNEVYEMGYRHALQNIVRNGGKELPENILIQTQSPAPVRFEESFSGHFPVEKRHLGKELKEETGFDFEGKGFVIRGGVSKTNADTQEDYIAKAEVYIDEQLQETVELPGSFTTRRPDFFWKYQLANKAHTVRIKLLNPHPDYKVHLNDILIYSDKPAAVGN